MQNSKIMLTLGAERRVFGARAPTKFSQKKSEEMEILNDLHTRIYPCKMLTFWYTGYEGMTVHVQIHVSITHQHLDVNYTPTCPYFPLIVAHRKKNN